MMDGKPKKKDADVKTKDMAKSMDVLEAALVDKRNKFLSMFVERILADTAEFLHVNEYDVKDQPVDVPPVVQETIAKHIANIAELRGPSKDSLARIFETICGFGEGDIARLVASLNNFERIAVRWVGNCVVVCSGDSRRNGHDYPLGRPLVRIYESSFMWHERGAWHRGNSLTKMRDDLRPADESEIRAMISGVTGDMELISAGQMIIGGSSDVKLKAMCNAFNEYRNAYVEWRESGGDEPKIKNTPAMPRGMMSSMDDAMRGVRTTEGAIDDLIIDGAFDRDRVTSATPPTPLNADRLTWRFNVLDYETTISPTLDGVINNDSNTAR